MNRTSDSLESSTEICAVVELVVLMCGDVAALLAISYWLSVKMTEDSFGSKYPQI